MYARLNCVTFDDLMGLDPICANSMWRATSHLLYAEFIKLLIELTCKGFDDSSDTDLNLHHGGISNTCGGSLL